MTATFEGAPPLTQTASPSGLCQIYDLSLDGLDRKWGNDALRAAEGSQSAWPARDGNDGYDPAFHNYYPSSMDTWIDCGPFDLRQFDDAYAQFWMWMDIPDPTGDHVFFGVSTNTITYTGSMVQGTSSNWQPWEMWYTDYAGESSVWLAWQFFSDDDIDVGQGVWLDDIRVWAYDEPAKDCDALDLGTKGLGIPPYAWWYDQEVPLFSDPVDLDLVKDTGTHWARLEFVAKEYGGVNFRDYDMIVDSLCGQDISILALVDYQMLARKDWNTNQVAYRNEFTSTLRSLITHFKNRIDYWEIWNEEDHPDPAYNVESLVYAELLKASYQTIKATDPSAKVLFGGTVGVGDDSRNYMQAVYDRWGSGQSYLDVLAVHPYFFDAPPGSGNFILNPQQYLHYDAPTYPTMLAKFLETMSGNGDSSKKIWTTEIGWNSAYGEPNVGPYASQVITRQLQADYLTTGFDILFNEVEHWNQPGTKAVAKVFWFGYQDFNLDVPLSESTDLLKWRRANPALQGPVAIRPMYFGLYDGARNRKPAFYNFLAYPVRPSFIFMPVVLKSFPPCALFATIVLDAPQPDGDNGWYVSDVEVSFTVPSTMPLPSIEYRLNLGNWQPFTMPFTITTEGENLVQIRPAELVNGPFGMLAHRMRLTGVTDEEILSFVVKIDKSLPTLIVTALQPISCTHGLTFTLEYQAADAYSGLAVITATLDTQPVTNGQVIDTLALSHGAHEFVLSARDIAGHTANQSVVFTVTTTISGLMDLKHRLYAEGGIYGPGADGIVQSLDAKLEAAQRNLEAGLPHTAINILQAFIHEVEAQTDQHITSAAASLLIEDAQRIIFSLSGEQSTYTGRK